MVFFEEWSCHHQHSILYCLKVVRWSYPRLAIKSLISYGKLVVQNVSQGLVRVVSGGAVELLILGVVEETYLWGVWLNFYSDNLLVIFSGGECKVGHRAVVDVLFNAIIVSDQHYSKVETFVFRNQGVSSNIIVCTPPQTVLTRFWAYCFGSSQSASPVIIPNHSLVAKYRGLENLIDLGIDH